MRVIWFVVACLVALSLVFYVWYQAAKPYMMDRVLQKKVEVEYFNDGAGGCSPEIIHDQHVERLLENPQIWQELISHIDSTASTRCRFEGRSIPLGYLCLDILLKSIDDKYRLIVFFDSGDDGLWTNVRQAYYFPPDVLRDPQGERRMKSVRANWQTLYAETGGAVWDTSKHDLMR